MRSVITASPMAPSFIVAPVAFADCVDFNQKRADAAGAALVRNAPSAAQLGLPSLDGLLLDGPLTTGDPKCEKPGPPRRFLYNASLSFGEVGRVRDAQSERPSTPCSRRAAIAPGSSASQSCNTASVCSPIRGAAVL